MKSKVFGVGEFKYAIQNFKGAKGVAMATKFGQKNLHLSVLCKKSRNFSHVQWVFGAGKFQYAIRIFKGEKGVAMATEFEPKLAKIALISVLWKK